MQVYAHGLENGVLLRPIGNVVYFMSPYIINESEIAQMAEVAMAGQSLSCKKSPKWEPQGGTTYEKGAGAQGIRSREGNLAFRGGQATAIVEEF